MAICVWILIVVSTVIVSGSPSDLIVNFYGNGCNFDSECNRISGSITDSPPENYERFGKSYYKYHRDPQLFYQARSICENEGGYLVVLNSEAEASFVQQLMNRYPASVLNNVASKDYILIGFHDLFKEGEYVTIHGQSLAKAGFIRWAKGEPDNDKGNENCGSLHRSGGLNDFPCGLPSTFVCEYTPTNCTTPKTIRFKNPIFARISMDKGQANFKIKTRNEITKNFVVNSNCKNFNRIEGAENITLENQTTKIVVIQTTEGLTSKVIPQTTITTPGTTLGSQETTTLVPMTTRKEVSMPQTSITTPVTTVENQKTTTMAPLTTSTQVSTTKLTTTKKPVQYVLDVRMGKSLETSTMDLESKKTTESSVDLEVEIV